MSDPRAPEGDDYSATVLGSHWFSGPPAPAEPVAPDRVEGSVLRFGPGVTAAMPAPFPLDAAVAVAAAPRRGRGPGCAGTRSRRSCWPRSSRTSGGSGSVRGSRSATWP